MARTFTLRCREQLEGLPKSCRLRLRMKDEGTASPEITSIPKRNRRGKALDIAHYLVNV